MSASGTIEQTGTKAGIWPATLAICYGIIINGIAASVIGPVLPALSQRYGVTVDAMGTIFTATSAGFMISVLGGARVMERIGRPLLIRIGLGLMAIGIAALAVVPTLSLALASSVCLGLGRGALLLSATVMIGDLHANRRSMAMNLLNTVFGVGALVAPALVGVTEQMSGSPSLALGIGALLAFTACLGLIVTRIPPQALNVAHTSGGPGEWLRSPLIWGFAIAFFLYVGVEVGFSGWIVTFLQHKDHLSLAEAAPLASAFWLGLTGGRFLATVLSEKVAAQRLIIGSIIAAAASIGIFFIDGATIPLLALAIGLVGFFLGPIYPNTMALATGAFVASAGGVTALMIITSGFGTMSLPYVQGVLMASNPNTAMTLNLILLGLLLLLQLGIMRMLHRHTALR